MITYSYKSTFYYWPKAMNDSIAFGKPAIFQEIIFNGKKLLLSLSPKDKSTKTNTVSNSYGYIGL